jgi:hypothetical protein
VTDFPPPQLKRGFSDSLLLAISSFLFVRFFITWRFSLLSENLVSVFFYPESYLIFSDACWLYEYIMCISQNVSFFSDGNKHLANIITSFRFILKGLDHQMDRVIVDM